MNRLDVFPPIPNCGGRVTVKVSELIEIAKHEPSVKSWTLDCNSEYRQTWYDLTGKRWKDIDLLVENGNTVPVRRTGRVRRIFGRLLSVVRGRRL